MVTIVGEYRIQRTWSKDQSQQTRVTHRPRVTSPTLLHFQTAPHTSVSRRTICWRTRCYYCCIYISMRRRHSSGLPTDSHNLHGQTKYMRCEDSREMNGSKMRKTIIPSSVSCTASPVQFRASIPNGAGLVQVRVRTTAELAWEHDWDVQAAQLLQSVQPPSTVWDRVIYSGI